MLIGFQTQPHSQSELATLSQVKPFLLTLIYRFMKKQTGSLLDNFLKLQEAARQTEDGQRCLIAPHPDLKRRLKTEMETLRSTLSDSVLKNKVRLGSDYRPVGFNDGLIYPGTLFPVGTSAEVARNAALNRAPLIGTVRVIVVLVDFSDQQMVETKSHYEDLFFSLGVVGTGSVREYYREVTHSIVDIQGEVVGPYRLPLTLAEYANGESGTGASTPNARTMAYDAAVAANPSVNFANYDNNSDGYVDAFIVIHAGTGAEVSGNVNDIWSHKWVLPSEYTADGTTKIYAYLTVPEDCLLGVCAHELGHLLFGFPDLYDTDNSSEGIGNWCLMASGSWNNGGLTPAHPCAWCKASQNWVTVQNQTTNQNGVAIEDVKSGYKTHRLWKDGAMGNEYFLVENRQKTLFDSYLPNNGLLVWHIDDATSNNTNESHYKVALMQADGNRDLELNNNRGDDGDSFPGNATNRTFNNSSTPNSQSYAGSDTCVSVSNISDPATLMQADLSVKCVTAKKIEIKESGKEFMKEKDIIKDKIENKEFRKDFIPDKQLIIDKTQIVDKGWTEKPAATEGKFTEGKLTEGKVGEAGFRQPRRPNMSIEERLSNLEAQLSMIQPFIEQALRPDLSQGALQNEGDVSST